MGHFVLVPILLYVAVVAASGGFIINISHFPLRQAQCRLLYPTWVIL